MNSPTFISWIAIVAAAALASCQPNTDASAASGDAADELPLVRVQKTELRKVRRVIETTGYLESEHDVTVLSELAGRVAEVLVDEGDRVSKGQVIARLDDREAQSAKRQVEVQLEDRKVREEFAKLEALAAERRVEQMRIEKVKAERQFQRNTEIDPGLITGKDLDESKLALDSAIQAVRVAEFDQKKAELDVKAAANAIAEMEAKLDAEELRLQDHVITSPIDGVVKERMIRGGEAISTATELFQVLDNDDLVAYLRRPQAELPLVRDAREVTFTNEAWPGREFLAKIDVINPAIDETNGSFRMRIRVAREDAALLRPGMFIKATILTEDERDALMVPKVAVLNERDKSIVYAVRDNVAYRVLLETGLEERDWIECKNHGDDGLQVGDRVVTAGHHDLTDQTGVQLSDT